MLELDKLKPDIQMVWYSDAQLIAMKWAHFGPVIEWVDHIPLPSCFSH
jgi:hypothetical protein